MKTIKTIIVYVAAAMICSTAIANHSSSDNITLNVKIYDDYDYATNWKHGDFEIKVVDMTSNNEVGFTQPSKSFNIGLARDKHYMIYISRRGYLTKFIEVSTDGANIEFEHLFFVDIVLLKRDKSFESELNYPSAVVTCGVESGDEFEIQDIGTSVMYLKTSLPAVSVK